MTIIKLRFFAVLALSCAASSLITARFMKIQQARADSNRVFELRIDKTYPGRLQALVDRLGKGRPIFERNKMSIIGYWIPQDSPQKENTLIYMVAHESREAAKKNNAGFGSDPEFRALQKSSEADGKIIEKFETTYLDPVDFSPIK
jgi:hypothetical protein